ncbi:hypothetical protein [Psychromicrobium sp. YIM B11713]|uniref:hypothetical protein n=1 Tax=Psychromicrobium sp. YIM B11713 TaxID=3145233 RepID=UPI00374E4700
MRKIAVVASTLLVIVGLAACSAPEHPAGSSHSNSSSASTSQGTSSSTAGSSTQAPSTAADKLFSTQQLNALIPTLRDANGNPFQVVPTDKLNQGIQQAKQQLASTVVSPKECQELLNQNSQIVPGSSFAGGVSASDGSVITAVSFKDAAQLSKAVSQVQGSLESCPSFSISVAGQQIDATVKRLTVKTNGELSSAGIVTESLPNGKTLTILSVAGVKGNLSVGAVKIAETVDESAAQVLTALVNQVFEKTGV